MKNNYIHSDKLKFVDIDYFNSLNDEEKLKLLMKDFKYFLYFVWDFLELPKPSKVQYDMADFLQDNNSRRMIQAYRGLGKTYITGSYVVWCLWKDPNKTFIIASATQKFAEEIGKFIKKILKHMPLVNELDPSKTDNNSVYSFDVYGRTTMDKSPSVKIASISGQITGSRADEIIADDIEVEKNSRTQTLREVIKNAIKEFTNIIKPGGKITYLGTPQTEDSIYKELPSKGYIVKTWTARYPLITKIEGYKGRLANWIISDLEYNPDLQGEPLNPAQHNIDDLMERELDSGKSNFLLQYMLDTELTDAERFPLKTSDLIIMDLDYDKAPTSITWASGKDQELDIPNVGFSGDRYYKPMFIGNQYEDYEGSVMSIDPSGRGNDETAYSIVKVLAGKIFVLDVGGLQGGYDEQTLIKLCKIAKEFKVNKIVIESNFGDGMYSSHLQSILNKLYPVEIEEVRQSTQKEVRIIDTLEPSMNRHKIVFNKSIINNDLKEFANEKTLNKSLMYQLTRITKDKGSLKNDDRLDALSIAIKYWLEYMSTNEEDMINDYKMEMIEKEITRHYDIGLGSLTTNTYNWI
jgi:hypothetical protein